MKTVNIIQTLNLAGIAVNVEMLAINHYYGIGGYLTHAMGLIFFVVSFIMLQIAKEL